jgi:hypothetical protein
MSLKVEQSLQEKFIMRTRKLKIEQNKILKVGAQSIIKMIR